MLRSTSDVDIAKERLIETWETTRDTVAPRLTAAREVVGPYVDTARHRLRSDVVPRVLAATETARETSAPARIEAKERTAEAIRALRGERSRRSRRWPLALTCLLGGVALGAAAGMMRRSPEPVSAAPSPFPRAGGDPMAEAPATTAAGAPKPTSGRSAG